MTIFVDAGEGHDSTVSFGAPGKKVTMHSKDNTFSITANANKVR